MGIWLALLGIALLTLPQLAAQTGPLNLPTNASFTLTAGSATVLALAAQSDGKVLVGGNFTHVNGSAQANLARLNADGTRDTTWAATVNGIVRAIVILGSDVFIGGDFTTVNGATWNRLAKLSLSNGALDAGWNPNASGTVNALATDGSYLFVGGAFTTFTGGTRNRLARFTLPGGALDSWNPNASNTVSALAVSDSHVYVGGTFTTLSGSTRNRLGRFGLSTGALDAWHPNSNGNVNALVITPAHVYAGGPFTSVSFNNRNRLCRFARSDGLLDLTWDPNAGGVGTAVNALGAGGTHLYAGGNFTTFGVTPRNRLARFAFADGALDSQWNPNASNNVNTLDDGQSCFCRGLLRHHGRAGAKPLRRLSHHRRCQRQPRRSPPDSRHGLCP